MRVMLSALLILLSSAAIAEPPIRPMPWVKLSEMYYTTGQVRLYGSGDNLTRNCLSDSGGDNALCNAVYMMKYPAPQHSFGPQTQNTPFIVDLTSLGVAADAKMALLTGELIITHPSCCNTTTLFVTFAAADDPINCSSFMGEDTVQQFDGRRSNATFMVPLSGGRFKYCYSLGGDVSTTSFGLNFSLQMWGR